MRVWLITVGEPLPTDGTHDRLNRTGTLANLLVARGHDVVWWTSTFDHARKRHRFNQDTSVNVNDRFHIKLLYSKAYKKNISFSRIVNHCGIARKFSRLAEPEVRPDIILCSLPTLELSLAAADYGEKNNIPVVLDVRDLWPDIFLELAPVWGRGFIGLMLAPLFKTVRAACASATAITGITPAFVDWGVNYAGRKRTHLDRDFPLGYSEKVPSEKAIVEAERFWRKHGLDKGRKDFIACFFGAMGHQFELETAIDTARKLKAQNRPFRFVLCGNGDNYATYRDLAEGCENIIFPGWVGAVEIWTLMRMSSVGLAPYRSSKSFIISIPNKAIEYMSAGLPVVSSLKGVLQNLLSAHECGVTYGNGHVDGLVSALIDLYDNPKRLSFLSKKAYALYRQRFVAEKVYGEMIDYLEEVARAK